VGLELARAYVAVRADSSRVSSDFAALKGPVTAQTSKIGMAMGRALSTAMVMGGVAGFAGIFAAASQEVVGFERKMVDVRANARLLGEEGSKAFQMLNLTARELGATTQFTARQSAEALDWMVLGGLSAQESIAAVPGVLNLASSANLELAESAKIVVDNMRKYKMEAADTGKIADFLSSAQSRAQITARDLAQGLQSLGSITTTMNVSFRDTVALLTGMGRAGTEMSRAGTALSMALFRLAAQPKEAEDALRAMNIQVEAFVGKESGVLDLVGLFKAIALAMPTDPIKKGAAAAALFGMRAREILGVLDLLATTTFVEETQVGLLEDLGRSAEVSEAKLDTFWGMLKKVRSVLGEVAIAGLTPVLKLIEPLLDDVRAGSAVFAKFISWVYKLGGALDYLPFQEFRSAQWKVIRIAGLLTVALVTMQFAVVKLSAVYGALGGVIGVSMAVMGKWKVALMAVAVFMDTVMIHSIVAVSFAMDGLAIAMGAVIAHPIIAMLVGLAAVAGVVALEWRKVNKIIEEGNKISGEFVERGKNQAATASKLATDLRNLAIGGKLSNDQMGKARGIVEELESMYGPLGVTIDRTTGKLVGMGQALAIVAARQNRVRETTLKFHLADLGRQYDEAKKKSREFFRVQSHWSQEMVRLDREMIVTQKELFALRDNSTKSLGIPSGDKANTGAMRRRAAEMAKVTMDFRRELFAGIQELDPASIQREFSFLSQQVSIITRQFPELEGAARRFLQLEWDKTPMGEMQTKRKNARLEQMREQMQKRRNQEQHFESLAANIRQEIETPMEKMHGFLSDIMHLTKRGQAGLPGGLAPEEAMKRLWLARRRLMAQRDQATTEPAMGGGRFGFADYGKSLQDAFMKSDDSAQKTAKNTALANKLLGVVDNSINTLSKSIPRIGIYGK